MMTRPLHPPTEAYPFYSSRKGRAVREAVYAKTDGTCWYCGTEFGTTWDGSCLMEMDHVVPRAHGGSDAVSNLVPCCSECNLIKGDRDAEYLRYRLYVRHITELYETGVSFSLLYPFAHEWGKR